MKKPIGEIIRRLRKERNLTQEELAKLLHVSGQAISRWENGTGMPDISQIVPIASVFGVSTDVLFDMVGKSDDDIANEIIHEAEMLTYDENHVATKEGLSRAYQKIQEALIHYPNNIRLLIHCLETGISLAYPENDTYDELHGKEIYKECVRQASLVISYGKNIGDVLRAHMIMVLLHSAYGNYESAIAHAKNFPGRTDMNICLMYACIHHASKEYALESMDWQNDTFYLLKAILYAIGRNGCAFLTMEKYVDAVSCFETCIELIANLFKLEPYLPPLHWLELGNIYLLLAEAYLKNKSEEAALFAMEQAVGYDLDVRPKLKFPVKPQSPLFRDMDGVVYRVDRPIRKYIVQLQNAIKSERFDALKDNPRYISLCERLENAFRDPMLH